MPGKFLSTKSTILLIFCMLALLKRCALPKQRRPLKYLTRLHAPFGILLLLTGLFHGILAGNTDGGNAPAMITGKLAWMLLLLLTIFALLKRNPGNIRWRKLHIVLAVSVFIAAIFHTVSAVVF